MKAGEFSKRGRFLEVSRSTPLRGPECAELQGKSSHLALSWAAEGSLRGRALGLGREGLSFYPCAPGTHVRGSLGSARFTIEFCEPHPFLGTRPGRKMSRGPACFPATPTPPSGSETLSASRNCGKWVTMQIAGTGSCPTLGNAPASDSLLGVSEATTSESRAQPALTWHRTSLGTRTQQQKGKRLETHGKGRVL